MPLRILALEPYYGGSHRAFLDGYREASRHRIELLTMPARKWKWRMRGAAITLSRDVQDRRGEFDLVFCSDYLDLATLRALSAEAVAGAPLVVYFHENQITYPLPPEERRDWQFAFTNLSACLAADLVLFNSRYHRDSFLAGARRLLEQMPDFVPGWVPERIRDRSEVLPVGVELESIDRQRGAAAPREGPLTILWNHRWEYDKGAERFFEVMMELDAQGRDFRLVVLGQSFRTAPPVFERALEALRPRVALWGYLESRAEYCRALLESDVVVSTALEEFFGISVVEAAYAGCAPLLPDGLSYPELLPAEYHHACLYGEKAELKEKLIRWIERPGEARALDLRGHMRRFGWPGVAPRLDDLLEGLCAGGGGND
ncbi:MAG: DUF3524 domain-containing protein [Planctomycetes bacterium]|nr:DUF3524 domain-containing protein [Planctomycetota bacterium]